jgi:DNA-binding transcriptional regulator YiaG
MIEAMRLDDLTLIAEARELLASGRATEMRKVARLSQGEVALFCGVDPAAVSRWESGQRSPRGAAAIRFARLMRELEGRATTGAAA